MRKLLISFSCLILFVFCKAEQDELFLQVDRTSITFLSISSEETVSVSSNIDFKAIPSQDWCRVTRSGSQLKISVTENPDRNSRTATITVSGDGAESIQIDVLQVGIDAVFSIDAESLIQEFDFDAESRLLEVKTNVTFTAESNEEWCRPEILSASKRNLRITVDKNNGVTAREAFIVVSAEGFDAFVIEIMQEGTLPNKRGMNLKGWVSCEGVGIPGVVVSDGHEVTVSDENGVYYLASGKQEKYVFISVPGNYEVPYEGRAPQFFKKIREGVDVVERHDFELTAVDNNDHVVLTMADIHLAKRVDDLVQFELFIEDINETIAQYESSGKKVYGLTLGDLSWDTYWYANNFTIKDYVLYMNKINTPVFNTMGNHDNNPYVTGDWGAAQYYCDIIGPNYYSFNLGNVHYVVLDDILYHNNGGSDGVMGQRNYDAGFTSEQINWLRKDLEKVEDKSAPLIVALHIPVFSQPNINNVSNYRIANAEFHNLLSQFDNVHIVSGHTHINWNYEHSEKLMEHNTAAVCATWWWTGYSGYASNHICKDGSVGGYGVWDMSDKSAKWHYKSMGYDHDYQFRTYDLNTIEITADKYAPYANATYAAQVPEYAGDYAKKSDKNEVLINIWGYDKEWEITVKEGGKTLPVTRVSAKDPLHVISYEVARLNRNATPSATFTTSNTSHMFKVKASSATSSLDIQVVDRFGRTYTETMTRPKDLITNMR
ncbi:calcineurin-like phosphoesterase C-terminal domain-containing protein [Proteiniphilum sp. UBA5384]|uniref:calcineurin-like phosphoesterase C-terminal domain-containing protein n=1 Tax=Proteiniphilum sp. UBA5384 TaxID=1947279 RepID=UPI0025E42C5B|nr:calcineurin-like phosphoesterase C-terminal domain-containing protein [Proteiniphilum sp. UBA5384]